MQAELCYGIETNDRHVRCASYLKEVNVFVCWGEGNYQNCPETSLELSLKGSDTPAFPLHPVGFTLVRIQA